MSDTEPSESADTMQHDLGAAADGLGRRRFLVGAGAAVGATALASTSMSAPVSALPTGASRFVPLAKPLRIADTRKASEYEATFPEANRMRIKVAGKYGVSNTATAVVITVAGVNGNDPGFVTCFPTAGTVPLAANLNLINPREVNANLATVKIGNNGSIDVFSPQFCEKIVDIRGYYEPVSGPVRDGRFIGLANAQRAYDSRDLSNHFIPDRTYVTIDVTKYVPADASGVVVNLAAAASTRGGFFTALPINEPENVDVKTSSLNVSGTGVTRSAGVIVPVSNSGGRRRFKVFVLHSAKIIVDVIGYFTGPDSALSEKGLFVPVVPTRLIDTRKPGQIGRLWPRWTVEVPVPSEIEKNASAIVANLAGVRSRGAGYLTAVGARQPITVTSNLNFTAPNQVVPNHIITPVTSGHGIQVYSSHGSHVVVDLAGYYTGTPKLPALAKYVNPAPPAIAPEWTLRIPKLGIVSRVMEGDPKVVTDSGHSWHWAGTGFMGQENAHVAMFAHRTEAGAPYYGVDQLANGDTITVTTADGREFTYRMVRRDLTDAQNTNILNATRFHPGTTLSLVACTVGYDSSKSRYPDAWAPTSLKYRIVVTFELVSWREI